MNFENLKEQLSSLNKEVKDYTKHDQMRKFLKENGIDVVSTGGRNLGRCYNAYYYDVICTEQLPKDFVVFLRKIGVIGYGQEYHVVEPVQKDGKWVIGVSDIVDSSD